MKIFCLTISILLFISALAVANVPAPRPPAEFGVEIQNDYPDYVFYVFGKSGIFENSKTVDKLAFFEIDLTKDKPYIFKRPENAVRLDLYLVAVKKSLNTKLKPTLQNKMLELTENEKNNEKNEDGIIYTRLSEFGLKCEELPPCKGNYERVVKVESLDKNGFKYVGFDKNGIWVITNTPTPPPPTKEKNCFGLFFFVLNIAIGLMFFRRR